ncbi:MAG TPA: tyrosine-type recombinase/integrase [Anaerolineae bacterium]|nr:tyrosine-type recombinase/integrase [Anaerolineae bacterium]
MPNQIVPLNNAELVAPDQNAALVYLAGLAAGSRRTMHQSLTSIARIVTADERATATNVPWHQLRFQHTQAIRAELQERYSHTTVNKMLSALRGVLKAAWKLGQMPPEAYQMAVSVENVKGTTVPSGRAISAGELSALLATCDNKASGIRDAAIIAVMYACGLRRGELVALELADYDVEEMVLRVRGKGNKERLVPVVSGAGAAVADWLAVRGDEAGALFWRLGRGAGGRLSTQAIYKMLGGRAKKAGIKALSPHDLRRTFVSDLLDAGADIATVQRLAGHANVTTTARYDRRDERAKRQAVELLHVPYRRFETE